MNLLTTSNVILLIILFYFPQIHLFPQELDYSYKVSYEIEVEESDPNIYYFSFESKTEATCLLKSETDPKVFYIEETYFRPLNDIQIKSKAKTIYMSKIPFFYPLSEDVFISNNKVYYFSVPSSITVGEKIYVQYEAESDDIVFLPVIEIANSGYYKSISVTIFHPDEINPLFQVYSPFRDIKFNSINEDDDETILEISDTESAEQLKYYPYNNVLMYIIVSLINKDGTINKTTPEEFVDWYSNLSSPDYELDVKDRNILSEELITANSPTDKLKVIYDYVRKNFRYIAEEQGINSIVPREPSIVLSKGYADCKERAVLVSAIAKAQDIKVNLVLVSDDNVPETKNIFPGKFNHVICYYENGTDSIFFDPTSRYCEFGNLPEGDIGKEAFILDQQHPRAITIQSPEQQSSINLNIHVSLDSLDNAKAIVTLKNDYFSASMYAMNELSGAKLENYLASLILHNFYKISLENFKLIEENENSLTFAAKADLSHFLISSFSKKYIPKTPFVYLDGDILERENDSLAIFLNERIQTKLSLEIASKNYMLQSDSLILGDPASKLYFSTYSTSKNDSIINISYQIKQLEKKITPDKKNVFFEFYNQYSASKTEMYILREEE